MNQENDDSDDEVLHEIDVYLSKTLANNIYVLQYPIRPVERPYDEAKYLCARIKPQDKKLEIEMELNPFNNNYSKAKGEQFAVNVDGKQGMHMPINPKQQKEQPKYYRSNMMDKTVFTSSNGALGQMNQLYHLGILKENKLHLTPVQSVLQMRPSFEHFDIYEKKVKDAKEAQGDKDYSTEEDDGEADKAELVTLKYSSSYASNIKTEPEQNWIPLKFLNINEAESTVTRESLYCKNLENTLDLDFKQDEFIQKLINATGLPNKTSAN